MVYTKDILIGCCLASKLALKQGRNVTKGISAMLTLVFKIFMMVVYGLREI